ncbi:DUF6223 family protein [Spirillospora sp. NPDC047418]
MSVLGMFVLAGPAAAGVPVEPYAADAYDMSAGRLGAVVAALLALGGVVMGGLALARPAAMALGGLVVATADGGLGTGNGLGGGVVALLLGLVAVVLGTLPGVLRRR